ncbi:hypothetical protein SAMN05216490_3704 [Mucilaginibacter mallensis]|uniref:Uncharacterized protein n=1 Tax=Mucilaginibacter mallensis TaxID=652787 RepID=A0A1H2AU87_MUCMA|nr:hypothetical protein [Mucilaginibacter mallensis]SDT49096.1 hypothetical protein SAMN05216490_3704 [Mucilaginibacter mallensis]
MKKIKLIIPAILLTVLLGGCSFIGNVFSYKDTSKQFCEALIHEDYNKCTSLMDLQGVNAQYVDTIQKSLKLVHQSLVQNFGTKLDYSFETAQKTFSTRSDGTAPGQTVFRMQVSNATEFGEVQVIFNDKSQKIFNFNLLDVKQKIPNMTTFWLFAIIPLLILALNIYVIVQIRRSNIKRKWLKYLAVILLNVPTIGYNAVGGIFFKLLSVQILFGLTFAYTGYLNSVWAFGVPLGSLFVLFMLKMGYYKTKDAGSIKED